MIAATMWIDHTVHYLAVRVRQVHLIDCALKGFLSMASCQFMLILYPFWISAQLGLSVYEEKMSFKLEFCL